MNMKITSVILGLFLMTILTSPVFAQEPDMKEGRGHDWKERMEARKQDIFRELNLTDEQKQKLEENRKKHKESSKQLFDGMRQKREQMRLELEKDQLDMAKIDQLQADMKADQAKMMDSRLQGILEVRGILTQEQFKKFSAKMEKHKERFKKGRWDKEKGHGMPQGEDPEQDPPQGPSDKK